MPAKDGHFSFRDRLAFHPYGVILGHGKEQPPLPVSSHASLDCRGRSPRTHRHRAAGGIAMGLTDVEMLAVIASLTRHNFYKSMTTYNNHRVWQDVYHGNCPNGLIAYIKLTMVANRIVIQFKEK